MAAPPPVVSGKPHSDAPKKGDRNALPLDAKTAPTLMDVVERRVQTLHNGIQALSAFRGCHKRIWQPQYTNNRREIIDSIVGACDPSSTEMMAMLKTILPPLAERIESKNVSVIPTRCIVLPVATPRAVLYHHEEVRHLDLQGVLAARAYTKLDDIKPLTADVLTAGTTSALPMVTCVIDLDNELLATEADVHCVLDWLLDKSLDTVCRRHAIFSGCNVLLIGAQSSLSATMRKCVEMCWTQISLVIPASAFCSNQQFSIRLRDGQSNLTAAGNGDVSTLYFWMKYDGQFTELRKHIDDAGLVLQELSRLVGTNNSTNMQLIKVTPRRCDIAKVVLQFAWAYLSLPQGNPSSAQGGPPPLSEQPLSALTTIVRRVVTAAKLDCGENALSVSDKGACATLTLYPLQVALSVAQEFCARMRTLDRALFEAVNYVRPGVERIVEERCCHVIDWYRWREYLAQLSDAEAHATLLCPVLAFQLRPQLYRHADAAEGVGLTKKEIDELNRINVEECLPRVIARFQEVGILSIKGGDLIHADTTGEDTVMLRCSIKVEALAERLQKETAENSKGYIDKLVETITSAIILAANEVTESSQIIHNAQEEVLRRAILAAEKLLHEEQAATGTGSVRFDMASSTIRQRKDKAVQQSSWFFL